MVTFTVNGQEAGSELKWEKGTLQVTVEAEAESHVPMSSIELVVNGQVVATEKAKKDGKRVRLKKGLEVTDSCWMAVRVRGEAHRLLPNDDALYAHTSPVYLSFKNRPVPFPCRRPVFRGADRSTDSARPRQGPVQPRKREAEDRRPVPEGAGHLSSDAGRGGDGGGPGPFRALFQVGWPHLCLSPLQEHPDTRGRGYEA